MKNIVRPYLQGLWDEAEQHYKGQLIALLERDPSATFADLGCDDGSWTSILAENVATQRVIGVDVESDRSRRALALGIDVRFGDLNDRFPLADNELDAVHSNQVIEHIQDLDHFVCEIFRSLKPGGYCVVCTENLSSWHNIAALAAGLQPFSLTNVSTIGILGNPFALHTGVRPGDGLLAYKTFYHTRVLAYQAFRHIFTAHGFVVEHMGGTGYHPFGGRLAVFLAGVDPRHSHFIYLKARKPIA